MTKTVVYRAQVKYGMAAIVDGRDGTGAGIEPGRGTHDAPAQRARTRSCGLFKLTNNDLRHNTIFKFNFQSRFSTYIPLVTYYACCWYNVSIRSSPIIALRVWVLEYPFFSSLSNTIAARYRRAICLMMQYNWVRVNIPRGKRKRGRL